MYCLIKHDVKSEIKEIHSLKTGQNWEPLPATNAYQ